MYVYNVTKLHYRLCNYPKCGTENMINSLSLAVIWTIFTLICVPRAQKTSYFLCLRRRTVNSYQRETNWSRWSRIELRVLANRKLSVGQVITIYLQRWSLICVSKLFFLSISVTVATAGVYFIPLYPCKMYDTSI